MSKRLFKQLIYGFGFFVFWSGVGTLIYFSFFIAPPSCVDNKQNQGEEGIDCGGPCLSCEIKTLAPIQVLQTKVINNTQTQNADLFAEIKNINLSWGIKNFQYNFILFDDQGNIVKIVPGSSYILPGEIKYLIETDVSVASFVSRVELKLGNAPSAWVKSPNLNGYALPVRSVTFRTSKSYRQPGVGVIKPPEYGFAVLSGLVKNDTAFMWPIVDIYGALYDVSGKLINFSRTQVRTLQSGEERFFIILWPKEFDGDVAEWRVKIGTNFYSNSTFVDTFRK